MDVTGSAKGQVALLTTCCEDAIAQGTNKCDAASPLEKNPPLRGGGKLESLPYGGACGWIGEAGWEGPAPHFFATPPPPEGSFPGRTPHRRASS